MAVLIVALGAAAITIIVLPTPWNLVAIAPVLAAFAWKDGDIARAVHAVRTWPEQLKAAAAHPVRAAVASARRLARKTVALLIALLLAVVGFLVDVAVSFDVVSAVVSATAAAIGAFILVRRRRQRKAATSSPAPS